MPRPKKPGAPEPKKRSRHGCWPCKAKKVKCGEERPRCANCEAHGEQCDYGIRLNWEGRGKRKTDDLGTPTSDSFQGTPAASTTSFGSPSIKAAFSQAAGAMQGHRTPPYAQAMTGAFDSPAPASRTQSPNHRSPHNTTSFLAYDPNASRRKRARTQTTSASPGPRDKSTTPTLMKTETTHSGITSNDAQEPSPTQKVSVFPPTPATPGHVQNSMLPPANVAVSAEAHAEALHDEELRKLSVNTFLAHQSMAGEPQRPPAMYGWDQGRPDIDLPRNDDSNALTAYSPSTFLRKLDSNRFPSKTASTTVQGFGFGLQYKDSQTEDTAYYSDPVPIMIPASLQPLPEILLNNKMNLLYFHHFLNHTARILVPHDCPENPFRIILPQMAVRNDNLLYLLLAYSASHRARLLDHAEPVNRIAHWVRDVFTTLRLALVDTREQISDANLAAAIMLASLAIMSPNVFEVSIPWQNHLGLAREMIIARGGFASLRHGRRVAYFLSRWFAYLDVLGSLSGSYYDRPLTSTTASEQPLGTWPSATKGQATGGQSGNNLCPNDNENCEADASSEYDIDCLLGFTSHCITILSAIANLAKHCDLQRIDRTTGTIREDWTPDSTTSAAAQQLARDLRDSTKAHNVGRCKHEVGVTPREPANAQAFGISPGVSPGFGAAAPNSATSTTAATSVTLVRGGTQQQQQQHEDDPRYAADLRGLVAVNECFHHAGLIHLHRRVLNRPSSAPEVQEAVRAIYDSLTEIEDGSTAEACMIFPLFTAGCEAPPPPHAPLLAGETAFHGISGVYGERFDSAQTPLRQTMLQRMRNIERIGMTQARRARMLMETAWETGRPWEVLVAGEFVG